MARFADRSCSDSIILGQGWIDGAAVQFPLSGNGGVTQADCELPIEFGGLGPRPATGAIPAGVEDNVVNYGSRTYPEAQTYKSRGYVGQNYYADKLPIENPANKGTFKWKTGTAQPTPLELSVEECNANPDCTTRYEARMERFVDDANATIDITTQLQGLDLAEYSTKWSLATAVTTIAEYVEHRLRAAGRFEGFEQSTYDLIDWDRNCFGEAWLDEIEIWDPDKTLMNYMQISIPIL
jgi:hypothetical protein